MFTRLAPIQMDEEHSRASSSLRKRRCVAFNQYIAQSPKLCATAVCAVVSRRLSIP
jgi:hypothetical protein